MTEAAASTKGDVARQAGQLLALSPLSEMRIIGVALSVTLLAVITTARQFVRVSPAVILRCQAL